MTRALSKKLTRLLTTSALALAVAACGSNQENNGFAATSGNTGGFVEEALSDQRDLTMFYQALLTTGVINELNDNMEYTFFAPTDAAFARIKPRAYPCFYSVQCRPQVAAILRNHIVPRNESVNRFSKWGGDIPTLGNRHLAVEEPYKGRYTVEGHRVLYQNEYSEENRVKENKISLYRLDGVIANDQDIAPFRTVPFATVPMGMTKKTVTTYRRPTMSPYVPQTMMPNAYLVPGGYTTNQVGYTNDYDASPNSTTETTTVTHTRTK